MANTIEVEDISASHASPTKAVEHAINQLNAALAKSRYGFRGESRLYLELRRDLPYIVHETVLPSTQILVNRNYKPLGHNARTSGIHVEYEQHRNLLVRLSQPKSPLLSALRMSAVSSATETRPGAIARTQMHILRASKSCTASCQLALAATEAWRPTPP